MAKRPQISAEPFVPKKHSLVAIRAALPSCKGSGASASRWRAAGRSGRSASEPFVGAAGKLLDRILAELEIDRSKLYVTNAVKHFKFVQRGKIRLHKYPSMTEINACRPWLRAEIDAIHPEVILCLGASASKSLLGGSFSLMRDHGKVFESPYANKVIATIHPSAVLRTRDEESRHELYNLLKNDLASAGRIAGNPSVIPM